MRRAAVAWLALQGVFTLAWWAGVLLSPPFRAHFEPPGAPPAALTSFWLADLVCLAGGSLAAAWGLARGAAWARPVLHFTLGAVAYATLYCLVLSCLTHAAWAGVALMVPAALLTAACAGAAR